MKVLTGNRGCESHKHAHYDDSGRGDKNLLFCDGKWLGWRLWLEMTTSRLLGNVGTLWQIVFQMRGFNDGGWFTLYPNFGEAVSAGSPYFFSVLGDVSIVVTLSLLTVPSPKLINTTN